MLSQLHRQAIVLVAQKLKREGIPWAIVGSTNMALQGMDVQPRDLDIVVPLKELERLRELFKEFNPPEIREFPPAPKASAWGLSVMLNGVEVQFFGEQDNGEYVSKLLACDLITSAVDEMRVPCFTLEAEARTYAEVKREKKAQLIRDFLQTKAE